MQESRRNFAKKTAMVVGATVVGASALTAKSSMSASYEADSNGVVIGKSSKKEILYKKTKAWEDFYKQAL